LNTFSILNPHSSYVFTPGILPQISENHMPGPIPDIPDIPEHYTGKNAASTLAHSS